MDVVIKNLDPASSAYNIPDALLPMIRVSGIWGQPMPLSLETRIMLEQQIREKLGLFFQAIPEPISWGAEASDDPHEIGVVVPIPMTLLEDSRGNLVDDILPEAIEALEFTVAKKRDGVRQHGGVFED
jgi:hypothetical protein